MIQTIKYFYHRNVIQEIEYREIIVYSCPTICVHKNKFSIVIFSLV